MITFRTYSAVNADIRRTESPQTTKSPILSGHVCSRNVHEDNQTCLASIRVRTACLSICVPRRLAMPVVCMVSFGFVPFFIKKLVMITVYSKDEFRAAAKAGEKKIVVKGPFADEIKKKIKRTKKVGIAALAGASIGLIMAPFTGGGSLAVSGLTAGGLTISTHELAIIVGGGLVYKAMLEGYTKINFKPDGSVTIEKN